MHERERKKRKKKGIMKKRIEEKREKVQGRYGEQASFLWWRYLAWLMVFPRVHYLSFLERQSIQNLGKRKGKKMNDAEERIKEKKKEKRSRIVMASRQVFHGGAILLGSCCFQELVFYPFHRDNLEFGAICGFYEYVER